MPILAAYVEIHAASRRGGVEGVGGFRVPLNDDFDTADLAEQLDLPVVLVVGLRLGCISHALLTVEAIESRGLKLSGWVANETQADMAFADENVAALEQRIAAPLLGRVPRLDQPSPKRPPPHIDFTQLPYWPAQNKTLNEEGITMSLNTLQEPKTVSLHRPTAAITLPPAATWPLEDVMALFDLPFNDLMFRAQQTHRANFPDGDVELATLLSIKTGGCEEDCATARRRRATTPALRPRDPRHRQPCSMPPARPRTTVRPASAWAPPGAARRTATWTRLRRWCAK